MKRQHEEKAMAQKREPENDLEMQMRILKQRQDLERDAKIVQDVVFVGLWLLFVAAIVIYEM